MVNQIGSYLKLSYLFCYINMSKLGISDIKRWKRAFLHFFNKVSKKSSDYSERWKIIEGFTKCKIRILKKAKINREVKDPILICVVLNEMERIKIFLNHYRRIGIKTFAILDNGSTDGTVEYLKKQKDVELFQTKDRFESKIKVGWINRIISYYGTEHWYLVVDADELLVWQDVEQGRIQDVIRYLDKRNITRARALMVDMYPKEIKWNMNVSFDEIFSECRYFDYDTYYRKKSEELYLICGGPRKRKLGIGAWLTKYPLFRLKNNEFLCNPHAIYPYENKKTPCYFAIMHYKFLTQNDRKKIRKYAQIGNYACNSVEYKLYLKRQRENRDNFKFYYKQSAEYQSSQSLTIIKQIDRIPQIDKSYSEEINYDEL